LISQHRSLPLLPACANFSWFGEKKLEKCLPANNLAVPFELEIKKY
jgi:hypothetical protein